jgi:hypothetical protein
METGFPAGGEGFGDGGAENVRVLTVVLGEQALLAHGLPQYGGRLLVAGVSRRSES